MLETRNKNFYFTKKIVKAKGKGNLITFQVDIANMQTGIFRTKVNSVLKTIKSRRLVENDENSKNKTQTNLLVKILSFLQTDNQKKKKNDLSIEIPQNIQLEENFSPDNISPNRDQVKKEIQKELNKENIKNNSEQFRQDYGGRRKKIVFDPISENEDWFYEKSIVKKLKLYGIFLRVLKNQTNLLYTYRRVLMSKNYREIKIIFIFFFLIYNTKTLVLITLRKFFENDLFFLIYRGAFSLAIITTVLSTHQFAKNKSIFFKKVCSKIVMCCYLYGISTVFIEIENAYIKEDFLLAFLEIMMICLVYTNIL